MLKERRVSRAVNWPFRLGIFPERILYNPNDPDRMTPIKLESYLCPRAAMTNLRVVRPGGAALTASKGKGC
jgi:hypothetical protein